MKLRPQMRGGDRAVEPGAQSPSPPWWGAGPSAHKEVRMTLVEMGNAIERIENKLDRTLEGLKTIMDEALKQVNIVNEEAKALKEALEADIKHADRDPNDA